MDTTPSRTTVAGFRIIEEVGRGAMGVVYLAEDSELHRVAVKVLAPELAAGERFRRRFLREAAVAATLDHPNIVATLGSGEHGGALYLALEYVDGSDLRAVLRAEGALEAERTLRIAEQAANALDAAHAAGLVHRDVKPSNLLVEGERVYVCDFGLARHVSSVGTLTGDRGFVGTIDYVAPEQIAGLEVDGRADQYALACVLFECLTGARPFERDTDLATVFAHLNEPPPRITDWRADLPRALDEVFGRALAKEPRARYDSCAAFVAAARAARAGEVPRSRRRMLVGAAAIGGTAVAAVSVAVLAVPHGHAHPARAAPRVTQESIDNVRLGMSMPRVKTLLGVPWRVDVEKNSGFPVVIFRNRQLAVYFRGTPARAIIVTTWNPSARTAAGVAPCMKVADALDAYGKAMRPSRWNSQHGRVFGYTIGKNLFAAVAGTFPRAAGTIGDLALYDGNGPRNDGSGVDVSGGTLPFVGYIALSETMCSA
jgi:serine/threonine-protein kinase